jgi:putative transposase
MVQCCVWKHSTPNMPPTHWLLTLSGVRAYRKRILTGKIAAFVEQENRRICESNTWTIGALNVRKDHVHLFPSAAPSVAHSQIAHILKGTTAHRVFQHFPSTSALGGASWSRSYFVGRVGDMSVAAVLK